METYICFLRGINVSGKNKVSMAELKTVFNECGFSDAATCLNSGNIVFMSELSDTSDIAAAISNKLKSRFGIDVPAFVISAGELDDILSSAPDWWGQDNGGIYDNLIFIIPPATREGLLGGLGEPEDGLEWTECYGKSIFWSFVRKDYAKTNWWAKTAAPGIGEMITVRTAGTVRKTSALAGKLRKTKEA